MAYLVTLPWCDRCKRRSPRVGLYDQDGRLQGKYCRSCGNDLLRITRQSEIDDKQQRRARRRAGPDHSETRGNDNEQAS